MTNKKRSIHLEGLGHVSAPIPMAARVGNMIFTSGISGKDPESGKLAVGAEAQAFHAFNNLKNILEKEGGGMHHIGQISILTVDDSLREVINVEWIKHFPDPEDRPARHTAVHDLRGGALLQLMAIAVLD